MQIIFMMNNTVNSAVKYKSYNLKQLSSMRLYSQIELIAVIKAEFPASLLQSSESRDPSGIILILLLKKHFWLLWMLKTVVLLHIFVENMIPFSLGYD